MRQSEINLFLEKITSILAQMAVPYHLVEVFSCELINSHDISTHIFFTVNVECQTIICKSSSFYSKACKKILYYLSNKYPLFY